MNKPGLIERFLFLLFVFLIPSQLALHFWPPAAFVYGIRVDYLSPTFYITDALALVVLFLWFLRDRRWILMSARRTPWKILALFVLAFINIFASGFFTVTLLKWMKIFEVIFLAIYVARVGFKKDLVICLLFYSAIFFSTIGIIQVLKGGTIGGIFYYLGERSFTLSTPGIALTEFFGREILRAYSTFPHPNAFAGFLGIIILLARGLKTKEYIKAAGLLIISTAFLLSFSLGAFIAMVLSICFLYLKKSKRSLGLIIFTFVILSLILPIVSRRIIDSDVRLSQSIYQRLDLAYVSGKMISEKPVIGEGLNTFIANTPRFKGMLSYQWYLQPVHNVFLLVFSEAGLIGILLLSYLIYETLNRLTFNKDNILVSAMLFIIITGLFDHYWITLQQNILMVGLLMGMAFYKYPIPHSKKLR